MEHNQTYQKAVDDYLKSQLPGMNSFCEFCTGNDKKEIRNCHFYDCVFHRDRWHDLEWQMERRRLLRNKDNGRK